MPRPSESNQMSLWMLRTMDTDLRARWHCQMCLGVGKAVGWLVLPWETCGWSCSHAGPAAGLGQTFPAATSHCRCQPLIQEQCLVTGSSAFSIFQVIPLQSGFQVTVKLQGGLGLDISADMDVSIWEQELKTGVNARSVGGKLLGSGNGNTWGVRVDFHSPLLFF